MSQHSGSTGSMVPHHRSHAGEYLLWVELPYSTEGVMRVAGQYPGHCQVASTRARTNTDLPLRRRQSTPSYDPGRDEQG